MAKEKKFPDKVYVTLIQRENDDKPFPYCGETISDLSEDLADGNKVAVYRLETVKTFRRSEVLD